MKRSVFSGGWQISRLSTNYACNTAPDNMNVYLREYGWINLVLKVDEAKDFSNKTILWTKNSQKYGLGTGSYLSTSIYVSLFKVLIHIYFWTKHKGTESVFFVYRTMISTFIRFGHTMSVTLFNSNFSMGFLCWTLINLNLRIWISWELNREIL